MMRTILILDDSLEYLEILKLKLERAKFDVFAFSSCVAAVGYVANHPGEYDFILSDLKMPDASGLDLLSSLRESDTLTPFYIMTADTTFDPETTKFLGGQGTLFKPFKSAFLVRTIEAALNVRAAN